MDKALTELIRISHLTGKDSALVQGGGGNTSVKTEDGKYMYIKASGTALKDMSQRKGWRRLKLSSVLTMLKDKSISKLKVVEREKEIVNRLNYSCDDDVKTSSRPSVESPIHALLDRCVVHLHPLAVGAYVCAKNGRAELQKLFQVEKLPPLWVPYVDPGYKLAIKMAKLVEGYKDNYGKKPEILFLQKHGLLLSANTERAVLQLVRRVIKICHSRLKEGKIPQAKSPKKSDVTAAKLAIGWAFFKVTGKQVTVKHFMNRDIAKILNRKDAKKLASLPALTPDELVYAHGSPIWLDKCDYKTIVNKINRQITRGEKPPASFLGKGLGLFAIGSEKTIPVIKDVVTTSLLTRSFATNFGGVNPLTQRQRQFINEWEAESFRQKITSS